MTWATGTGAPPSPRSGDAGAEGAGAFGLVPSSTSDTRTHLVQLDREGSRYRRLRRNVLTTARLLRDSTQQDGFRGPYMAMLTLTYGPGVDWAPHHITDLNKCIREWLKRQGHDYAYIWVCELQQRGAPHYHVLIFIPYGVRLPKADKRGWWPYCWRALKTDHLCSLKIDQGWTPRAVALGVLGL